jgi:hypothetical protein
MCRWIRDLNAILGGNAISATWSIISPLGSGSFSNVNTLTSTFTPNISSGTITLRSTTNTPNGSSCNSTAGTDDVVITVNSPSVAPTSLTASPTVICNEAALS